MLQLALALMVVLAVAWVVAAAAARWFFGRSHPYDEVHHATTADGWTLSLLRIRPQGTPLPIPVVLGHGLMMNRRCWDAAPEFSLARWLAARGHDVWIAEYRGASSSRWPGPSRSARWSWGFDAMATRDLPAIIDAVRAATGAPKVSWVGHSMGGMLIYAYAAVVGDSALHRIVTLGSPVRLPGRGTLRLPPGTRALLRRLDALPADMGTFVGLPLLLLSPWGLAHVFNPRIARRAEVLGVMAGGVVRTSTRLLRQFDDWQRTGLLARDGSDGAWEALASAVRAPLLVISGTDDRLARPWSVRPAYEAAGSRLRRYREFGTGAGEPRFGHIDLIASRAAREHVFPDVARWLEAGEDELGKGVDRAPDADARNPGASAALPPPAQGASESAGHPEGAPQAPPQPPEAR